MKNLAIMLVFVMALNFTMGIVVDTTTMTTEQKIARDRMLDRIEAQKAETTDLQDNKVKEASQTDYTSDIMPPIDTNLGLGTIIKHFKNGISAPWNSELRDSIDNVTIKHGLSILTWLLAAMNISLAFWILAFAYAKIFHT